MGKYSRTDILRLVEDEDVQFIRMQFTDIFGQLKNVAVTSSQIQRALAGEIMLDGSSIQGSVRVEESDQYLQPDLDTFTILPWRPQYGKVARLICNVYNPDGTPFAGDPRNVLKRALEAAEDMGFTFNIGPELEFFLFQTDENGKPTTRTSDEAGYFDLGPLDHGESTRREVALTLEQMGLEVEASHHEAAAGQHEIDLKYADALTAADNIMTFKLAVKTLAQKNGLHATFMPKPVHGMAGSGMHINMSLFRDGRNVFYDEDSPEQLSALARQFIAGLLAHAKGFCALANPLVNSYKRFVPGYEAPCYLTWSSSNRSTLIRIPDSRGRGTRVELRSPDGTCNPYLVFAACLAAGLDGIRRELTPPPEFPANIYAMSRSELTERGIGSLPLSLEDALDALEADPLILSAMGPYAARYIAEKRQEWEEYRTQISQWEVDRYLIAW
ncbi:MAG: type I glutamate--ammonia ligase [Oscillospiraceae bacterium]|nr:type I glutamate--ammonia ligase [Oscillospiraceae bacterium]